MPKALGSLESSEELIRDLYVDLRQKVNAWSRITKQTAQARMGYIGQHLVSVATGFPGGHSGARGKDLILPNGKYAEIKTCYRVDQLGRCNDCGTVVSSLEIECSACNSAHLQRNDDSKWLIGIQHDQEFADILSPQFYYLVLFDFTDMKRPDTIRASIWRVDPRVPGFAYCMIDYYRNIRAASTSKAPFNLWPFQLKFELMRPILIYQSLILPDNTIQTLKFPGRDAEETYPLSPLLTFSRSRNLSAQKIKAFAKDLKLKLPNTENRLELLEAAAGTINKIKIPQSVVVDKLAKWLYWPEIEELIETLPEQLRNKIP
jgi:hypothetical protein